ncbi:MAG: hypothetical protein ACI9TY_000741 [Alphaproteobacteria bacterium]|jgi:hypothetical protein
MVTLPVNSISIFIRNATDKDIVNLNRLLLTEIMHSENADLFSGYRIHQKDSLPTDESKYTEMLFEFEKATNYQWKAKSYFIGRCLYGSAVLNGLDIYPQFKVSTQYIEV